MVNEKLLIDGEHQIYKGGEVDPESSHVVPVDGNYFPWHQGKVPDWKSDSYAEFVRVGENWSLMRDKARRIKVDLESSFSNTRNHHDWKGYDNIEPTAYTKVMFNDKKVGTVRGWPNDITRHLLAVSRYIDELQDLGVFGWFSPEDLAKVVGKQVKYRGRPAVVAEVFAAIEAGEVMIYCPTEPDDGYDRGGRYLTPVLSHWIEWYPDTTATDFVPVEVPNPLYGSSED